VSTQIQIRRDTTANWESVNPVLADGEIGYDTTVNRFKVGNGADAWRDIEYSGADGNTAGGSPVHIGDTAPSDPAEGDLWYDTDSDTLFLFDGTAWFSTESCGSGGIEEAPEDGTQYARKDATWEPVEAFDDTQISADLAQEIADRESGDLALQGQIDSLAENSGSGGGPDLLERVVIPFGSNNTTKVELTGFDEDYDNYELVMRNVSPSGFTAHLMSVISMGLEITDKSSSAMCESWTMSYWRSSTSWHFTQSPFSGTSAPIFGSDNNANFTNQGGLNGSIKIFSGSKEGVNTSQRPDFSYYLSEGATGRNGVYFRNYGRAEKQGRVSKLVLQFTISPGLQSGEFDLLGWKRG